jgi:hypothetical protein
VRRISPCHLSVIRRVESAPLPKTERIAVRARPAGNVVPAPHGAPLDAALASFAGALAANDPANIARRVEAAAEPAPRAQLEEPIATAPKVQDNATPSRAASPAVSRAGGTDGR